jgi:hypothetical protein
MICKHFDSNRAETTPHLFKAAFVSAEIFM